LGSGELALVLDIDGLAARAEMRSDDVRGGDVREATASKPASAAQGGVVVNSKSLLLYEDVDGTRTAVPLEAVERIESATAAEMQNVAGRWMLPYRGEVLHVEGADERLTAQDGRLLSVIILAAGEGQARCALLVRQVMDIAAGEVLTDAAHGAHPLASVTGNLSVLKLPGPAAQAGPDAGTDQSWRKAA
jgi:two-component system chemotaxis sensor kinase CheA